MKNQSEFFSEHLQTFPLPSFFLKAFLLFTLPLACAPSLQAQLAQNYDSPHERELLNTLPGNEERGSILDATNPMDLLNQLRRATAMDNATSPSDAIDEALRAFEVDESEMTESYFSNID